MTEIYINKILPLAELSVIEDSVIGDSVNGDSMNEYRFFNYQEL